MELQRNRAPGTGSCKRRPPASIPTAFSLGELRRKSCDRNRPDSPPFFDSASVALEELSAPPRRPPSGERDQRISENGQRREQHRHAEPRDDVGDEIVGRLRAGEACDEFACEADDHECRDDREQDDQRRRRQPSRPAAAPDQGFAIIHRTRRRRSASRFKWRRSDASFPIGSRTGVDQAYQRTGLGGRTTGPPSSAVCCGAAAGGCATAAACDGGGGGGGAIGVGA